MKMAAVFDSAGTLLNVYRVAKDVAHGRILEHVASTDMVLRSPGSALVALRVDSFDFLEGLDGHQGLAAYIAAHDVGLDVICRGSACPDERVAAAARQDTAATLGDMQEAIAAVKLKCKDIYYVNMGFVVDVPRCAIPYVLATGGRLYRGVKPMFKRLQALGVDAYIASGDNRKSLAALARELGVPDARVYDALSPTGKLDLVKALRGRYDRVAMVGDGPNDRMAIEAADLGVLTVQQPAPRGPELYAAADVVVEKIGDAGRAIEESLHT